MAVGAGSIKRASKLSGEGVTPAEKKTDVKKTASKKTTASKSVTTKETTAKSIKTDVKVLQNTANKVYHITEELPIYLL